MAVLAIAANDWRTPVRFFDAPDLCVPEAA